MIDRIIHDMQAEIVSQIAVIVRREELTRENYRHRASNAIDFDDLYVEILMELPETATGVQQIWTDNRERILSAADATRLDGVNLKDLNDVVDLIIEYILNKCKNWYEENALKICKEQIDIQESR